MFIILATLPPFHAMALVVFGPISIVIRQFPVARFLEKCKKFTHIHHLD